MNLKETYNKIATDWFQDHHLDDWWIDGTNHFISLLKSGDVVLDAGCGAGVKSKYLIDRGMKVIGVDFSEKLLEIAEQQAPLATFHIMDMKDVGTLKTHFDGVFAQASLLHIPKKEIVDVIERLVSVLKVNGYIYIAVKGMRPNGREEEIVTENDYGYDYARFFSYYRMDELENYFRICKLNVMYRNIKTVGRTDWLQIIGQKNTRK